MAKLNVNINKLELKNPVMTASGTFGYGLEFNDFISIDEIGGIIVKGTTLEPRQGRIFLFQHISTDKGYRHQHDCECERFYFRRLCIMCSTYQRTR